MTSSPSGFPAGDPVPAITEADATGETAAIYADIRATTGVPVVNLIWRHLATMPDALPWTWGAVQPLYASGAVAQAAAYLRASLVLPPLPDWPPTVLACAGLSADDRRQIGRVLASYDRSNAMNLCALGALRALANGRTDPRPIPAGDPPTEIEGELPALLTFDRMAPATADLVYRLNAIGDPEHRVIASMYRHLAHWPAFLALVWERLAPLEGDGRIGQIILESLEAGADVSRRLAAQMQPPAGLPDAATLAQANAALDLFIRHAIGRMVPIGRMLAAAFPRE